MTSPAKTPRSTSNQPSRILCGTDFSAHARQAVLAAGAIAGRLGEPVLLAHALDLPDLGPSQTKAFKGLTDSRRRSLQGEANQVRRTGAVVETRTLAGRADEALVDLAGKERPRLLVVSSLGRRGAKRWFLGSVAERTAERVTVPTLVVRNAAPLTAWARGERPLRVFVCFNFTVTSEAALRWVNDLRAIGPCEVVVGYVNWPVEEWTRLDGSGPVPLEKNTPVVQAALERDVHARAAALLGDTSFRLRVEVNWGRPEARLADMAKAERADLIVVGSHQYRGFERLWHTSVSRGLLHRAETNVVVVPQATGKAPETVMAPPMRHVMVTTDFSPLANSVIPRAYSLLPEGGIVHLVHVVLRPSELPGGPIGRRAGGLTPRQIEACAAKLRALVPAGTASRRISTQIEVFASHHVAEEICRAAERLGVEAICLGSHGRSGLSKALLGSVAQHVMAHSRRPLFIVRPQPE